MFWRGWFVVPVLLLGLLIGGATVAAVAHWDDDDRGPRVVQVTSPSGNTQGTQVIEVHDRGWHRGGWFPGFFLLPLLFFLLIIFCIGAFFRRGWGGPGGPWRGHWNDRFEEWHREQHRGDAPPAPPAASA